ncbi:MAG: MGMT family protein [Bacteroidales bacterium]|nr:MGMT family protein [Bacteroidales bacterium]
MENVFFNHYVVKMEETVGVQTVWIASTAAGVIELDLDSGVSEEEFRRRLEQKYSGMNIVKSEAVMHLRACRCLEGVPGYYAQPDLRFVSDYQRRVYEEVMKIPRGETVSYSELAARLGQRGARAVGHALGSNRIAILVPCHRVIPKRGGFGFYRWGAELKAKLLTMERNVSGC